jgi:hypothetical protein
MMAAPRHTPTARTIIATRIPRTNKLCHFTVPATAAGAGGLAVSPSNRQDAYAATVQLSAALANLRWRRRCPACPTTLCDQRPYSEPHRTVPDRLSSWPATGASPICVVVGFGARAGSAGQVDAQHTQVRTRALLNAPGSGDVLGGGHVGSCSATPTGRTGHRPGFAAARRAVVSFDPTSRAQTLPISASCQTPSPASPSSNP